MHVEQERDPWARVADRFVGDHYKTIRGRVRTHVIDQHLNVHLPSPPASIVDVGGGGGTQALPLARRGYDVTIVDASPAMLEQAADALTAESEEVASRVQVVEAKGEQAFEALGGVTFEGVLCHGVLPYVDDPEPLIASLCVLCAEDGIVSIVAKNQTTLAVQPALEGRWSEALSAFDATQQVNRLGFDTRADTVEDLTLLLERNGVGSVAWYGVRLFTDGWIDPEPDDLEDVLAVELEASRREPYRAFSRLFHLIGQKSSMPELMNASPG